MHPPSPTAFRQAFARRPRAGETAFALGHGLAQSEDPSGCLSYGPRLCLDTTPSLEFRPFPVAGRPDFFALSDGKGHARPSADITQPRSVACELSFIAALNRVNSAAITTQRGKEPCVNILSFSHLRPQPLRAACRPRPSAGLAVLSRVPRSLMRWMKTWSQGPRLVRWPGLRPAACRGCRPAVATDLIAACGRRDATVGRPSGHVAPVAFVISAPRPGRGGRGERCSRRS